MLSLLLHLSLSSVLDLPYPHTVTLFQMPLLCLPQQPILRPTDALSEVGV